MNRCTTWHKQNIGRSNIQDIYNTIHTCIQHIHCANYCRRKWCERVIVYKIVSKLLLDHLDNSPVNSTQNVHTHTHTHTHWISNIPTNVFSQANMSSSGL